MTSGKSPQDERSVIVSQPAKRPYGAILRVHVQTAAAFGKVEEVGIPLATGAFITLAPVATAPGEGGRKYSLTLEGFATAAAAEAAGRRMVQAVLWMAISTDSPLRLEYQSYDPFSVFERTRSIGISASAYCEVCRAPSRIFGEIQDAYTGIREPDPMLLLSMEIFAGARLEASDRARFLAIVSALEPLAGELPLGDEVGQFVDRCLEGLKEVSGLAGDVQRSLRGRVNQLRTESVRQALRRTICEILPNRPEAVAMVDSAYALRSEIIHTGRPADLDVDLERESRRVADLIREIYAIRIGRKLVQPVAV
jgi:hypothetical protein